MQPSIHAASSVNNWNVNNWYVDAGTTPVGDEQVMAVPVEELPGFPNTWRVVSDSHSGDPAERFIAYVTGRGLIVTVHSTADDPTDKPGRLIALISLGRHRVAVSEAGHGRFDARWDCDGRSHCLAAAATTLAGFMSLVLNLAWI